MIFYFTFACILFLFSSLDFVPSYKKNYQSIVICRNQVILFFTIVFITLGGIRWLTGTDWNSYFYFFSNNSTWKSFTCHGFELGYTLLNYIIKHFTTSYTVFLLFFHFFVILPKVFTIKKLAVYPLLSFFLYWCFYLGEIVAVRNALGVSILLCSIPSIEKRNKKTFFLFVLLATSIHYSCAFWIVSYFIYHKKISKENWIIIYLIAFFFMFLGKYIYPYVINGIFKSFETKNEIARKILIYTNSYNDPTSTLLKQILSIVKRMLVLPFFFIFYSSLVKQSKYNRGLLNLYLFGNAIYFMFFYSLQQMNRLVIANIFLEVILLPEFISCFKNKAAKMLFIFLLFFYGIFKLFMAITPFSTVLVPFYTIFNYQYRVMI